MRKHKTINASAAKTGQIIAMSADVTITAAEQEGEKKGPPTFAVTAYNGGPLDLDGWDLPTVVDLAGLQPRKAMVANLDHKASQRVGNVNGVVNDQKTLVLNGSASAHTAYRDEVVASAADGFQWQASIEATPGKSKGDIEHLKAGKTATVNGQAINGPAYIVRRSTLKGFAFVSHGADDSTVVNIAAAAASTKENDMEPKFKEWLEAQGLDADVVAADENLSKVLKATWEKETPAPKKETKNLKARLAAEKAERERIAEIEELAVAASKGGDDSDDRIQELAAAAIEAGDTVEAFELSLYRIRAGANLSHFTPGSNGRPGGRLNSKVLEAALCIAGRLSDEKLLKSPTNRGGFDEQTLEAADREFNGQCSLYEALWIAATANGYRGRRPLQITAEIQNYAFGLMGGGRQINAASTVNIGTIVSATANKFLREGWNAVDLTPLEISSIRSVRDFKTITTVSLTGDLSFKQVGAGGEIQHGTLGERTYTNKADTYARMLALTRTDLINDDVSALSSTPMKLGRGAALKLNEIFWTEFLNNTGSFFTSGNANVNEGVANMTSGGLAATEVIFMSQTDPDSNPLGISPKIILVPTALKAAAMALMNSERVIDGTSTALQGDANIWRGRFRVASSPYMHNTSYTGYSAQAWYMLADPAELPVIEIVALNGRVEPVVETADAAFNVLGIQMRGYSDIGVNLQEYRGGVRADGNAS